MFAWIGELAASDLKLRVALGVGALALLVTLLLMVQLLLLRTLSVRRQRGYERVVARWRPLLLRAAAGDEVVPPRLPRRDASAFLLLWNQMQDGLRGAAHRDLNRFATRLKLVRFARRRASRGQGGRRVIALRTLGHIGLAADWDRLAALLDEPRSQVSLAAARALLQIDALRAAPLVLDQFLARNDWPLPRLGTLLREAGSDAIGFALAERLLERSPAQQVRLLPLARVTEAPGRGSVIEAVLAIATEPMVLAATLPQVHGPTSLPRVRELTRHADWQVRSYAALALGRNGSASDRTTLIGMLGDPEWWVRYRAAQALGTLPGVDEAGLKALLETLGDRFARDMLRHVLAERSYGGAPQ